MNRIFKHSVAYLALMTGASALMLASPSQAQQSPFAGDVANPDLVPNGGRLNARYDQMGGAVDVAPQRAAMSAAVAGFAAAAEVQNRLPQGFTLRQGSTARIPGAQPARAAAAPNTGFAAPNAAQAGSADDKFVTVYPIAFEGVPLAKGSDYMAVVDEDGRLLHTRERSLPNNVDATEPTITAAAAQAAAEASFGNRFAAADTVEATEPELEIWVPEDRQGRLTWTFSLFNQSLTDPVAIKVWVAAAGTGTPEILMAENQILHTHHGQVTGTLWSESPFGPTVNQPLEAVNVQRTGAGGGTAITGEDGRYSFTTGSGDATIDVFLAGPHSVIENAAGAVMADSESGGTGDPLDLNFGSTDEQTLAQMSAFHWTVKAQKMAGDILDPATDRVDLEDLRTIVNINDSCNAFYHPVFVTTNYFQSGRGCPNTAYADVVSHEYGHALDDAKGGILDGGYSEGFGDAMSIMATRQPCLGRDFRGEGTCLRPADEDIDWPPAPGEGVHAQGRRYAGFTWELVQQLRNTYSDDGAYGIAERLVLAVAQANPSDIPDAVHLSFVMDDDDGDLANGTPHFKELAAAADSRNLPRPADPVVAHGVVTADADFSFVNALQFDANSNIVDASFSLTEPTTVHITANSSAHATTNPVTIRTGFYNSDPANIMWTNSLRHITLDSVNDWVNFGSSFAIDLPAGDHTIYWKIWTSQEVEFSSGSLLVEALGAAGPLLSAASESVTEIEAPSASLPLGATQADAGGRMMTVMQR